MLKLLAFASLLIYISAIPLRPSIFMPFGNTEQNDLPISDKYTVKFYDK